MNNIRTNSVTSQSTQFRMLDESQCSEIFDTTLRILDRTGCEVKNDEALSVLRSAGARVNGSHVRIPPGIVERALRTAPSLITIYDTEGNPQLHLSARSGKNYWTASMYNLNVVDRHTNQKRLAVYNDAYEAGLVMDSLPNYDLAAGSAYISDRDSDLVPVYQARALLEVSSKPQYPAHSSLACLEALLDMYSAVAGGRENFLAKPFALFSGNPTTPLLHTDDALERAIQSWKLGVPAMYSAAAMLGASSPVTLAGGIAVGLADALVGLVLSQEINPGTPFIPSIATAPFDMGSMSPAIGKPEMMMGAVANADIFRYLDIPSFLLVGGSHAHLFDEQAAGEIAMQVMAASLAGCCISNKGGDIDSANSAALESLVYCNEIIGMARYFVKGIEVSVETLAEDVVDEVGPDGDFLSEEHTLNHFRESWTSDLFASMSYENWVAEGKKGLRERCVEKVDSIVTAGPRKPRSPELLSELDDIIKACENNA